MKTFAVFSGWSALVLGLGALFVYIVAPSQTVLVLTLVGMGFAGGMVFFLIKRTEIMHALKSRAALHGMNTIVLVIVVLGILVFVNLISFRHKHRLDFTETGFFTLATQSKKIVSNLPRGVKMTAFFQTESPEKSEFQNLVDGFLEQSDKLALAFVDPDKNPAITKQYGITTYGTVVFESGKQETQIKEATEENLVNALLKVTRDEQKTVYFLHGHGEVSLDIEENEGYSQARKALLQDGFKVEPLLLVQAGAIPENASLVVIAGPQKPVLPEEQKVIDAYLNSGGSVMLLVDPQSRFSMEDFLLRWGIEVRDSILIDPMSKLFGGDFAAPVISDYQVHEITRDFRLATIFPVARSVTALSTAGDLTVTELLKSSPNSWAERDFTVDKVRYDEGMDQKGPVPIAALATKKIKSDSSTEDSKPETTEPDEKPETPLKAKLLVIGDSDFANNGYFNFSGNGDFFLNAASWLAEEEGLIAIRPRERKNNPLTLTRAQGSVIFILGTILFPALVIGAGLKNWWRRRRL